VSGQAVRLTVAGGSFIAVERDRIEWIERAGIQVLGRVRADLAPTDPPPAAETASAEAAVSGDGDVNTIPATEPRLRPVARDFAVERATRGVRPLQ
jgi:hypothetical protein